MIVIKKIEMPIVLFGVIFTILFSYITYSTIGLRHFLVFAIGIGLGFTLYKAAFGFTGGWRNFIDVPLALNIMFSGYLWPIVAWGEFMSGDFVAEPENITISPR